MSIFEAIQSQIDTASTILVNIVTNLKVIGKMPHNPYYTAKTNTPLYDKHVVDIIEEEVNRWQYTCKSILMDYYGAESDHVKSFEGTIVRNRFYIDEKEGFRREVSDGRNILSSILEAEYMKQQLVRSDQTPQSSISVVKTPMVFVSHSHYDKDVAEALVDLLENIGFDSSNLFCSSVDGYGIGLSEDIFETLRTLFNQHNLYVIFIHSPRYYKSAVSLNEMGAAWVLRTDFCSILTPDIDFNELEGVVDSSTISIKVDNADAPARLTQLKDKLIQVFGLKGIDSIKWERKRNAFLKKVKDLKYLGNTKSEVDYNRFLSDDEFQILKEWVYSGNQFSSQRHLIGDRIFYHLGNRDYESRGAEMNAEWDDFFERLSTHGLITISGVDKSGYPKYKLKKAAFDYVKTNSKE